MGLAAMQWDFAPRGTGEVGPARTRADGVLLPRAKPRRGRDSGARGGPCAVARTCDRTPGEPGIDPLDAPVHLPERCDSSVLQEWMTWFEVDHPCRDRAGRGAQLFDREGAERVLMAVATDAPPDSEGFSAQRSVPQEDTAGERLGVRGDGQGGPLRPEAAVTRTATLGRGEQRPQQTAALVGVSSTVDPTPRAPAALAALLVEPAAARARRPRAAVRDAAPRAPQVRRLASLVRTTQAVMACIQADAARRDPQHRHPVVVRLDGARGLWRLAPTRFRAWRRLTCGRDSRPVGGDRWSAANAWCGAGSKAGTRWVQAKPTAMLDGRVGDVSGGLRPLRTTRRRRQAGRETRARVITCFQHHRRWMQYDASLARGLPVGTGVVESACGAVVTHRLEGDGQRWSLAGAEAMLAWRSLRKSHDHALRDDWKFQARQVRPRLYATKPH